MHGSGRGLSKPAMETWQGGSFLLHTDEADSSIAEVRGWNVDYREYPQFYEYHTYKKQ